MMQLCNPSIPTRRIKYASINYEFFNLLSPELKKLGIECVATEKNTFLPPNICGHSDLQFCILPDKTVLTDQRLLELSGSLKSLGFRIINSEEKLEDKYPNDCLFNVLIIGKTAVLNTKSCANEIIYELNRQSCRIIDVSQGYTRCSTAVVSQNAAITADKVIAQKLAESGFDVLKICPGSIDLYGYEYGFIGGCCGLISPNEIAFTGSLDGHPNNKEIKDFLHNHDVKVIYLTERKVFDIGGIIQLSE